MTGWFTFPPYDSHEFIARTLGRDLEGVAARLLDHQVLSNDRWSFLVAAPGTAVTGTLLPTRLGDDWLLDDAFAVNLGYFRRQELQVVTADGVQTAWAMLGGPTQSF